MPRAVPFIERINGTTTRRKGFQIGASLIVATTEEDNLSRYMIYNLWTGEPAIPNEFSSVEDAVELAERLNQIYGDYWEISQVWPELDIIKGAQWSVKDGVRTCLALSNLARQGTISLTDFDKAWVIVKDQAEELTRRYVHIT